MEETKEQEAVELMPTVNSGTQESTAVNEDDKDEEVEDREFEKLAEGEKKKALKKADHSVAEEIKPKVQIKILIDWTEGSALVGVQRIGDDPIFTLVNGSIEEAISKVPGMLVDAKEKWDHKFRYETYKPPVAPAPPARPVKPPAGSLESAAAQAAPASSKPASPATAKPKSVLQNKMW